MDGQVCHLSASYFHNIMHVTVLMLSTGQCIEALGFVRTGAVCSHCTALHHGMCCTVHLCPALTTVLRSNHVMYIYCTVLNSTILYWTVLFCIVLY